MREISSEGPLNFGAKPKMGDGATERLNAYFGEENRAEGTGFEPREACWLPPRSDGALPLSYPSKRRSFRVMSANAEYALHSRGHCYPLPEPE